MEVAARLELIKTMGRICLLVARFCLVGWLGMGIMFLSLLLSLRGSELFSVETKDNHPRVLFPVYYTLEFVMLGSAGVACCAAQFRSRTSLHGKETSIPAPGSSTGRLLLAVAWLAIALASFDYLVIYRPLAEMLGRPPYPANFRTLHETSRWINTAVLLLTAIAAIRSLVIRDEDRTA